MSEKWSDGLPDNALISETEKIYRDALTTIKDGISKGLDFTGAAAAITIDDESLKKSVIDDILKVIIAEEHLVKQIDLDMLAKALNLPMELMEKAKSEMLEDIENSAVTAFYTENETGPEH